MQEMPKRSDTETDEEQGTAEADQTERPYYYDDAHGYEVFRDDECDEDDDQTLDKSVLPKPR